ncbi:flotillin family protein [Patescibacteria group bacterium]|nr:flotillin family protein [Patescibacteria group bacterium]
MIISAFLPITINAESLTSIPLPRMVMGSILSSALVPVIGLVFVGFLLLMFFISRYKRCPSNKILVVSGKTGEGNSSKCIHGGAAFIWPVIQEYQFLDLQPIDVDVPLRGALSMQNIRVNVPSHFTIAVSNEPGVMQNAAERLLGLSREEIRDTAKEIIFGQIRSVIATMSIEEINTDREQFLSKVNINVDTELKKIGLHLINVNITDITDDSGYIEALGKKAAATVIEAAKVATAVAKRDGDTGQANADQERKIQVAKSESLSAIGEADAEASAVEGKNQATILIEKSNSERDVQIAELNRIANAAKRVKSAAAETEALNAEKQVQDARKAVEKATKEADEVVDQEIEKEKTQLRADAAAYEVQKRMEAEADGLFLILKKKAEGIDLLVKAAGGNPKDAAMMLIVDKIQDLATIQADAMKNIKVDKLTVYDSGNGDSLKNTVHGLFQSMPALNDFLAQSGMSLPPLLGGAVKAEENGKSVAPAAEVPAS